MGYLRNDKIYSGNTRLKKVPESGAKETSHGITVGCPIFLAEYEHSTIYHILIPTFTGNLQGFFISYVVVRQIDALHRMPSQGLH